MNKILAVTAILFFVFSASASLITINAVGTVINSKDSVHYTFVYDLNAPGYAYSGGEKILMQDLYDDMVGINYFYTDFLGGYILPDGGQKKASTDKINLGSDLIYGDAQIPSILLAGTWSHYVQLFSETLSIKFWEVNTPLFGVEELLSDGKKYSKCSRLVITSITGNVPEPSITMLSLIGCTCIAVTRKFRCREKVKL
jgi:hypothetical protein